MLPTLLLHQGMEVHKDAVRDWLNQQNVPFVSVETANLGLSELGAVLARYGVHPQVVLDLRWKLEKDRPDPWLTAVLEQFPEVWVLSSSPLLLTQELAVLLQTDRVARFNGLPTFFPDPAVIEVLPLAQGKEEHRKFLTTYFAALGKTVEFVEDTICFSGPRILAMIINEAFFCLQEGVATEADIDTAMRLGTNYPRGPIAWGKAIGLDCVCAILDALYAFYHQERYRCARSLRMAALSG